MEQTKQLIYLDNRPIILKSGKLHRNIICCFLRMERRGLVGGLEKKEHAALVIYRRLLFFLQNR